MLRMGNCSSALWLWREASELVLLIIRNSVKVQMVTGVKRTLRGK